MSSTHHIPTEPIDLNATEEGERLDFNTFIDEAVQDVKRLVRVQKELIALSAAEKAAGLSAKLLRSTITAVAALFILLFLNLALAFYLADVLDSNPLGFLAAAGVYAVLVLGFNLYWNGGGKDRFMIDRINDLTDGE